MGTRCRPAERAGCTDVAVFRPSGDGSDYGSSIDWCPEPDLNRQGVAPEGFSCPLRLSPPPLARLVLCGVWGLDFPFAVPREVRGLGGGRQVSTPSGCSLGSTRRLGSGLPPARTLPPAEVSPNLTPVIPCVSARALKLR